LLALLLLFFTIPEREANGLPHLRSESVLVRDVETKKIILTKNPHVVRPIASVTKLLSALVLDRLQQQGALTSTTGMVTILDEDKDRLKWSKSRLQVGRSYPMHELLEAALIASDNRAMYASVRARGISRASFVEKMNAVARELGMEKSEFKDPAGIDPGNVSTASDLLLLIDAVASCEDICKTTQTGMIDLVDTSSRTLTLYSPNRLARSNAWQIVVGKTGYTVEAGRSLVLRARIVDRVVDMVFLGGRGMVSVLGDAGRVRRWMELRASAVTVRPTATSTPSMH